MFKWVKAGHIISLGLFIYLLAYVGSETIIDEEVTVPANDYLHYAVRVYPGQGIQACAGVRTLNGTEYEYGVLELMMMDDAGYNHFLYPEEYTESGDRTHEWVGYNDREYIEADIRWFGVVHIILNNRRAVDHEQAKDGFVMITLVRPLGYLGFPSLVVTLYGVGKWVKARKQVEENTETQYSTA